MENGKAIWIVNHYAGSRVHRTECWHYSLEQRTHAYETLAQLYARLL